MFKVKVVTCINVFNLYSLETDLKMTLVLLKMLSDRLHNVIFVGIFTSYNDDIYILFSDS